MDQEEYDLGRWQRVERYTVEHPHRPGCLQGNREVEIWEAGDIEGVKEYGRRKRQRREQRRSAYRTRMEEEESFREEVDRMIDHDDSKAPYRPRREEG